MRYRRKAGASLLIAATMIVGSCGDGSAESDAANALFTYQGKSEKFDEIFRRNGPLTLSESKDVLNVAPEITLDGDVVWASDPEETQVRKYNRQGELIFAFGKRGQGPGELDQPIQAVPLGGDTLLVLDRGQIPQMVLYDTAGDTARFIGSVNRPTEVRDVHMLAKLSDGRFAVAAGWQSLRVPMGVDIGEITEIREGAGSRFVGAFSELSLARGVPSELVRTYMAFAQTVVGARDSLLFVAAMMQDTITVYNVNSDAQRSFALPTQNFRPFIPYPDNAALMSVREWRAAFSVIDKIFAVSDSVLVVQFADIDIHNRQTLFTLVGVDFDGRRLIEINGVPRLLAWDDDAAVFVGMRENDLLPSHLEWYSMHGVNAGER
jgi:hypothetical protein